MLDLEFPVLRSIRVLSFVCNRIVGAEVSSLPVEFVVIPFAGVQIAVCKFQFPPTGTNTLLVFTFEDVTVREFVSTRTFK